MGIVVTEHAAKEIRKVMSEKKKSGYGVRIGLVSNSCSSYSYNIDFEKIPSGNDVVVEQHGMKFFVAKKSLPMLNGIVIGFIQEKNSFVIKNPNIRKKPASSIPLLHE